MNEGNSGGSDSKTKLSLQTVQIELKDSSLFGVGDLKDPTSLAAKLRDPDPADHVSQFLHNKLSNNTRTLLREYNGATPPSEKLQAALIQELNQLLKDVSLYDEDRFAKVTLRKETKDLIDLNRQRKGLIHLNRFLLEDAYPQEIAKSQVKDHDLPSSIEPGDKHWGLAKKIALCALTNHTSIIRHWSWIHLIPATQFAFATRTLLGPNHPLGRLLWPHIYGTVQATKFGSMAQMAKGGDFENVFSFPQKEMCKLFDDSYEDFRLYRSDPRLDAKNRVVNGLKNQGVETPTQDNLEKLFDCMYTHTEEYLKIYYDAGNPISQDGELVNWLNILNTGLPGGIREVLDPTINIKSGEIKPGDVTLDSVARLIACFIYLVTVQHEMMGSLLWNYQLWTHRQPTRVYKNGGREPLDVYQRLVNYNFMLMVKRTRLMDESTYCRMTKGLPKEKKEKLETCYRQFVSELKNIQSTMDAESWEPWRIYPKDLEAHINA